MTTYTQAERDEMSQRLRDYAPGGMSKNSVLGLAADMLAAPSTGPAEPVAVVHEDHGVNCYGYRNINAHAKASAKLKRGDLLYAVRREQMAAPSTSLTDEQSRESLRKAAKLVLENLDGGFVVVPDSAIHKALRKELAE